ncbi:MAG: ferrous iron transport protein A [candidate division KSB1 bacterium]|nr:ferrous iron transport protein A [candidate division KSB1 bacterium]MDZ7305223.1 ferrous iron transport protein A [candidate division KSB1 bacterium]MDZ7314334.1 ferrous iron transport protein A [candidate division KSB1 bacterium]
MSKPHHTRPLLELPQRLPARITRILDGPEVWQHLHAIGVHPGDCIEVLRKAPFGGPIHIRCSGQDIALGRNLAMKILVEPQN